MATVAYLRQHRRRVENAYSNTGRVNLRNPHTVQRHNDDLVALAIAILVYSIGYMGLRQPEIFRYDGRVESPPDESPQPIEAAETHYERSGSSDIEAAKLKAALLSLMASEHPYRDPDLTLPELAERLDTTPHKLSERVDACHERRLRVQVDVQPGLQEAHRPHAVYV